MVVDDEPLAIEVIAGYIQHMPFLDLVATCNSPIDALVKVQKQKVDIVFLDIHMQTLNGIQFMDLMKTDAQVIIVSGDPEYALKGYQYNVVGYLLKPVPFEQFYKAVQKVYNSKVIEFETKGDQQPALLDFLFIKTENKFRKVNYHDILYCEGLKNYISIFTSNHRYVTLLNMKNLEEMLPSSLFVRVHKSYIVPFKRIDSIEKQNIFISDKVIPIGETFSAPFFSIIDGNRKKVG
jgi:two-component system LytT family response regulator